MRFIFLIGIATMLVAMSVVPTSAFFRIPVMIRNATKQGLQVVMDSMPTTVKPYDDMKERMIQYGQKIPEAPSVIPIETVQEMDDGLRFVMDLSRNFTTSMHYKMDLHGYFAASMILSPLDFFIPVTTLAYTSGGNARQSFLSALGIPARKMQMVEYGYKDYFDELSNYGVYVNTTINVPLGLKVKPSFVNLTEQVFRSNVKAVDLKKVFDIEHNDDEPSIVLTNVIYLKGIWKSGFDRSRTAVRPFYTYGQHPLNVETMYTIGRFRHGRLNEFKAEFIELPYKSDRVNSGTDRLSMFIILPDKNVLRDFGTKKDFLKRLQNQYLMTRLLNSTEKTVEIYLPKFQIWTDLTLPKGVPWFFYPDSPIHPVVNVSNIFESSDKNIRLDYYASSIGMAIDEEGPSSVGSSGIAYNTVESSVLPDRKTRSIPPEVIKFRVDRPYVAIVATTGRIITEIFFAYIEKGVS